MKGSHKLVKTIVLKQLQGVFLMISTNAANTVIL